LHVSHNALPPWKTVDKNGTPGGIDVELLKLLADRMSLSAELTNLPFKRGLKMLETGDIDLMTGILRRPEREDYVFFISPPYKTSTNKAFFVLKGNETLITKHEDLYNLRIGTKLGSQYYPQFDNDRAIPKNPVSNDQLSIKMLMAGRIDTFVMTESTGDYYIAQSGLSDTITKAEFAHRKEQNVYMVLSKESKHAHRLDEFNKVMAELIAEGAFETIRAQFFNQTSRQYAGTKPRHVSPQKHTRPQAPSQK